MEYTASCCLTTIDGMPINAATSERVLLARCKAEDHVAFMELIRRSSPAALRAIRNIARNPADVDDVMQARAHYRDRTNGEMQRMLNEIPCVKDGFRKLLHGLAAETREQHERGCLLLSANLQRDTKDAGVRDLLRDNQATVEEIFAKALKRAQKQGELSTKEDPGTVARFFVVTIQGMRAMARLKSDRRALEQVAQVALSVFK